MTNNIGQMSFASEKISVAIDGIEMSFPDTQPYVDSAGRTQVPVRFISEGLKANVTWDSKTQTVLIKKSDDVMALKIGYDTLIRNGDLIAMDTTPKLSRGRTMVPLRFVSENLGIDVEWIASENKILLTKKPQIDSTIVLTERATELEKHIKELSLNNEALGRLYNADPVGTKEFILELESMANDINGPNMSSIFTFYNIEQNAHGPDKGAFAMAMNGNIENVDEGMPFKDFDMVLEQGNCEYLSTDAFWVMASTLFGKTEAAKIRNTYVVFENGLVNSKTDVLDYIPSVKGSIDGYDYILEETFPSGFRVFLYQKNHIAYKPKATDTTSVTTQDAIKVIPTDDTVNEIIKSYSSFGRAFSYNDKETFNGIKNLAIIKANKNKGAYSVIVTGGWTFADNGGCVIVSQKGLEWGWLKTWETEGYDMVISSANTHKYSFDLLWDTLVFLFDEPKATELWYTMDAYYSTGSFTPQYGSIYEYNYIMQRNGCAGVDFYLTEK
jgi:hypothetical protein